ncbi:MAG: efflux RND transporter periplasmic adaptor subunit [Betaproteobacteria bacterium]|nr:efflux RND transporter periplasmic adaptor subunit [Betaproteobacteria bacterium]NBU49313.1 efflux RND transporter periplasmic adaptor subunit [Betaproteobacteria bacterium]
MGRPRATEPERPTTRRCRDHQADRPFGRPSHGPWPNERRTDLNQGWTRAAWALGVWWAAAVLVACGGAQSPQQAQKTQQAEPAVLSLGSEDIWVAGRSGAALVGAALTGAIQAERRADLRAEVGSVVLRVVRDNGEPVKRGELLVKLDDAAIRDTLVSAEEALRAAERSLEGAERTFQRLKSLQSQGMSSVQAMEDSEVRRNLAQSEQVAAKARVATARQQLERTEVRAPFDGVLAARKVSAGDTATMGKELVQVIDPASLRMEALVPAERVGELRVGQAVKIRVQGVEPAERDGRIRRIDSVAQPVSRQVAVVVDLVGAPGRAGLIAGLYAEGSVDAQAPTVLAVPETALVRQGDQLTVWALQGGTLKRVPVSVQPRDVRTGLFVVTQGLKAGDQVLRSPGSRPVDGQRYTVREG